MRSSPGLFLGLREAPVMVCDGDSSATKFNNGTSSPAWPSGVGEVQNRGVLTFLSSMWGSLASELIEMVQHTQEDELGFALRIIEILARGAPIYRDFSNYSS
jgi:hypothetical protein